MARVNPSGLAGPWRNTTILRSLRVGWNDDSSYGWTLVSQLEYLLAEAMTKVVEIRMPVMRQRSIQKKRRKKKRKIKVEKS